MGAPQGLGEHFLRLPPHFLEIFMAARMFDILRSATSKKIGVHIKNGDIYYFFNNEITAIQTETGSEWTGSFYRGDDIIKSITGTKENVANDCISHSLIIKKEIEDKMRFGTPQM